MTRAESARFAGMKRQALRDAVIRSNAEGLAGLKDRPKGHPPQKLSEAYEAAFAAAIFRGPDRRRTVSRLDADPILCRWLDVHFAQTYHPSSLKRVLRRMELSRQKIHSVHPQPTAGRTNGSETRGLSQTLTAAAKAHPDRRVELWLWKRPASAGRDIG